MTEQEKTIQQAAALLHAAAPGSEVILFGSHSNGLADEKSDIDFLVVEPTVRSPRKEMVRLRRVLLSIESAFDVLVIGKDDFDKWSRVPGTIYHEVAQKGHIINA
jgi:predicted nucleotidyltransferase